MTSYETDMRRLSDPRLCLGCGVCSYVCSEDEVQMVDIENVGVRPKFSKNISLSSVNETLLVCPTVSSDFGELKRRDDYKPVVDQNTEKCWGAISGIWEGHACDEEIRFKGSSGGALTAISQYCLEVLDFHAVLHTGEDSQDPIRNKTRLSRSRKELLDAVGSRYSPASVCEGLNLVENASRPCVVIGKPVEIAATRNAMRLRAGLAKNIGVTLSFFCAETPPTVATRSLLKLLSVHQQELCHLRYRGYGWPGNFVTRNFGEQEQKHWSYQKTWAYLQKFRPWATHMWPDLSGELADISCGDPWYEEPDGKNPGFSLIVARTKLGKEIIEGAIKTGYLTASKAETWKVYKSQEGLLSKKRSIWGRRLANRVMGIPNTEFIDLDLFNLWLALPLSARFRSVFGTIRRILQYGLWKK